MDEKLEEAVIGPGHTVAGDWPEGHPATRARALAQKGMEAAKSGELPPWTAPAGGSPGTYPAPSGDSVTDEDVIRSIYNLLMDGSSPGHRALAPRFMEMMKERGVISQEGGDKISKGNKIRAAKMAGYEEVDADDMEDALHGFEDEAGRQSWASKQKGPKGVV